MFGASLEHHRVHSGLLYVDKRDVSKSGWDRRTRGEYSRWTSTYGSVTFNLVGYQFAWARMNETGLTISTVSLGDTRSPAPDARPALESPFRVQYQLDNCSTVQEVMASKEQVGIANMVDHYLVCDQTGSCAVFEFPGGEMACHTRDTLPVPALTNSGYDQSLRSWGKTRWRSF